MSKKKIDISFIKENDLDKTSSFTDLMSRTKRRKRKMEKEEELNLKNNNENVDIEDMINEKKKTTYDLTKELKQAQEKYNDENINTNETDEKLSKTQLLELTRQIKFNFEEVKSENNKKKNGITFLNIIGILNLLCTGFYIYLLTFTDYQDKQSNYLIVGGMIILLVLFFGVSVISGRKARKVFNIFNLIAIISFIAFNFYTLLY